MTKSTNYGPVSVTKNEGEPAKIAFPAQTNMDIAKAESFWGYLMDAITLARELDGDPL